MTIPWGPIVFVDISGSILTLLMAVWCAILSRQWIKKRPDDAFRHYIHLLTLAIVFFAVSRSFGHLIKQILLLNDMERIWTQISPYSGAVNTLIFVVIFSFGIYFHRFRKVQLEIEAYKNNLEQKIVIRTKELEEANQTLNNVLNSSNPICITDIYSHLLQANEAYYSFWPEAENDSSGVKCYKSRPGSHCNTEECPLQQIIEGKKKVSIEVSKKVNGTNREFIVTARPFRNTAGKLLGIVESFQDITERKQAEMALASERERLTVTLRCIGDGVITTDLNGRILLINKIAEQLTGWCQQDACGRSVADVINIVNEKTGEPCNNPVDEVLATEEIIELENHKILISQDGVRFNIEDSGAPIFNDNGKIIGSVMVLRDVTEKRKIKKELLRVEKLESVGILAGGIAHDFNNILAAILGNISLSLQDSTLSEKTCGRLDQAQKASLRAQDLTQQLLTFAKGGQPIKKTASLGDVVKDSVEFVLSGTKLKYRYLFANTLWLVDIDKGQIGQVLQNIVLNACDAMPDGGTVEISCQNVSSTCSRSTALIKSVNYVKLEVKDTGGGIPQEIMDKIFNPYFSTKPQGNGLGLAITHSIVSKHDGHVSVESTLGVGTTVTVYLPVASQQLTPARQAKKVHLSTKKARILVMDDEELVRNVIREMLKELGHEVLLSKDGREAVQTYREAMDRLSPIDMVIMDLTIPGGMGGKEAVQEILSIDPQAIVIVTSGYSNDPILANFEDYGFRAAIPKPLQLHDLRRAISQFIVE